MPELKTVEQHNVKITIHEMDVVSLEQLLEHGWLGCKQSIVKAIIRNIVDQIRGNHADTGT